MFTLATILAASHSLFRAKLKFNVKFEVCQKKMKKIYFLS
jgi:hypothetical protein